MEGRLALYNKYKVIKEKFERGDINDDDETPAGKVQSAPQKDIGQSIQSVTSNNKSSNLDFCLKNAIDSTFMPLR